MAKRSKTEQPKQAHLTTEQMRAAIPILQRRIAELQEVDVSTIQKRGEPRFDALDKKLTLH